MTEKNLQSVMAALAAPFPVEDIYWKPQAMTRDRKKALAVPYADGRAYEDCLNQVVPGDWASNVTFTPASPKIVCTVTLTVCGITRTGDGEASLSDENAATGAYAQAFKRAAMRFGLGRYLYDLSSPWVAYDQEHKRFPEVALSALRASYARETGLDGSSKTLSAAKAASGAGSNPATRGGNGDGDKDTIRRARTYRLDYGRFDGSTLGQLLDSQEAAHRDYIAWLAGQPVYGQSENAPQPLRDTEHRQKLCAAAAYLYLNLMAAAQPQPA